MNGELDPLLDAAPGGFLCVNDDGTIERANLTLAAMLSMRREALLRCHIDTLLAPASRIFYQTHVFPCLKLQARVNEVYVALRDAKERDVPVLLNAQRLARDGRFVSDWLVVPMRQRDEYENKLLEARAAAEAAMREKEQALASVAAALGVRVEELPGVGAAALAPTPREGG